MSGSDFEWPWQYKFPPFFTLQKNKDVRKTQIDSWCSLITTWGKHKNVNQLDIAEASSSEVFRNKAIERSLPVDSIREILGELEKRGNWRWEDKMRKRGSLFWRTPNEWANQLYSWAEKSSRIGTVCTLYEITQGEDSTEEEFYGLDSRVVSEAIKVLEAEGRAEQISMEDSQGVKFL